MEGPLSRIVLLLFLLLPAASPLAAQTQEAQWLWASGMAKDEVPTGTSAFFRKGFNLSREATGHVEIAADDAYALYVNGRRVGTGRSSRQLDEYDISRYLTVGRNVVAIQADNTRGSSAAMAARVMIQPEGARWYSFSTDDSWRVTTQSLPMWQTTLYNDRRWDAPQVFGPLGDTVPWDRRDDVASATEHQASERFQIQNGFSVQRIMDDERVGPLIAMAFNEFGHLIASQEGGPLILIYDRDRDEIPEEVRTYCDKVTSCQGILPLNGEVFVTGIGPDGPALYRLSDDDRNGTLETVRTLVKFEGSPGEHGAHGIALGPDGMLYLVLGNHTKPAVPYGDGSTLTHWYEGDLVVPRYEDPGGHARGIKAPGGTVIRTDLEGKRVELVAGGLRNAYDLAFHPDGGLLVHDSDMESDMGTTWYRPTSLYEVVEGGEYGWRSGWSKWPEYYPDRLPTLLDTGRGSPTGAVVYEHYMFPARYHGTVFLGDWSEGRIVAVRTKTQGGGMTADSETFLQGQPLNVTDLEVGPDGALYFCTGGRGTAGGIYRVVWDGSIPDRMRNLGSGVAAAIRQPQLSAAWSRQKVATLKRELGEEWDELIAGVAYSNDNPAHYRTRALELMQLFGPAPTETLLVDLSRAPSEAVRAKAAAMMATHASQRVTARLEQMLEDRNGRVRRAACEALLRCGATPDAKPVVALLAEDDPYVTFAARRLLEQIPIEQWQDEVLSADDARTVILGGLGLVTASPKRETALAVLERLGETMQEFVSDEDFIALLRVMQVALDRGEIHPDMVRPLSEQIAEEFPASEGRMNRELVRLAAYLDTGSIVPRALRYLDGDAPLEDRALVAMYLRFLDHPWSPDQRFELIKFYETAAAADGGSSYPLYLMNVTRDFAREHLTPEEAQTILAEGDRWPNAALGSLYKIPRPPTGEAARTLRELDEKINGQKHIDDVYRRLRTGIVALLATAPDEDSQEYLRKIWREDPERRQPVAMALARAPDGTNWDYLVRSLGVVEGPAAEDVLKALASVDVATDDPDALRQAILLGLRAEKDGASSVTARRLLSHWTGRADENAGEPMRPWQQWYAQAYPDRPPAELPRADEESRWDLDQLMEYLATDEGRFGDPLAGAKVYASAQCAACHRFGGEGQSVGPDLTSVARRFTRREVLESTLYPSHMISDQYRSKRVLTLDGHVHTGLVSDAGNGRITIRDANNETVTVDEEDVDQILASHSSIMPSGLLDPLSLEQISDLMAYLGVLPPVEVAGRNDDERR